MTTEWKVGDSLRVLDASQIIGVGISDGEVYRVIRVEERGLPYILPKNGGDLIIHAHEMKYVERVFVDEDTTARNAELGEPSPECNCADLADIREELTDIKAMIGRLLQREQAEVGTLYAQRLNGANFATGADLAEKASAIIDGEESE